MPAPRGVLSGETNKQMKKTLKLLCALSIAAPLAFAGEVSTSETTTTAGAGSTSVSTTSTTMGAGTVTTFTPGSAIIVKTEAADPVSYKLSEKVTYVTADGKVVQPAMIKAGVPVKVHYIEEGGHMVADRVIVEEKTTTTTTE